MGTAYFRNAERLEAIKAAGWERCGEWKGYTVYRNADLSQEELPAGGLTKPKFCYELRSAVIGLACFLALAGLYASVAWQASLHEKLLMYPWAGLLLLFLLAGAVQSFAQLWKKRAIDARRASGDFPARERFRGRTKPPSWRASSLVTCLRYTVPILLLLMAFLQIGPLYSRDLTPDESLPLPSLLQLAPESQMTEQYGQKEGFHPLLPQEFSRWQKGLLDGQHLHYSASYYRALTQGISNRIVQAELEQRFVWRRAAENPRQEMPCAATDFYTKLEGYPDAQVYFAQGEPGEQWLLIQKGKHCVIAQMSGSESALSEKVPRFLAALDGNKS